MRKYILAVLLVSISLLSVNAQTVMLFGNTHKERCDALINYMTITVPSSNLYVSNANIKYTSPFFWSRIYAGVDAENASAQLEKMLDDMMPNINAWQVEHSSDVEFYIHNIMHGYLLCKDKISESLKRKVRAFIETTPFNTFGNPSTLNLDLMHYAVGLMCAQEWPDIKDGANQSAAQIINYNKPRYLKIMDNIFHNNCSEIDCFVYLPTDMMTIRMMAEFSADPEIQQRSYVCYQQIMAAMVGAWNQGLYVANPPRSKGWSHMVTGPFGPNSRNTAYAWLLFGNRSNKMQIMPSFTSDTNNYACSCFWMAYQRNIYPLPSIFEVEKNKVFPYEYKSYIDVKVVDRNNNISNNWKYYKYTYQSQNYGLATQTEIPYNLSSAATTYAYKETKRNYLAWQDEMSNQCFFSVCQDNPERPTDVNNRNAVGYGENPYHRVLQHKGAAIGITNVPTSYLKDKWYQLYVPFTRKTKRRVVSDNWVWVHAGSMMFAFRTYEPFNYMVSRQTPTYFVPSITDYDLLMFQDVTTHKGSWILQTTEITDDLKGATYDEELDKFKAKVLANCKIETENYTSNTPTLIYTTVDGDVISLTYFPPTAAYSNQYKINGVTKVLGLNEFLFSSPYTQQIDKTNDVQFFNTTSPSVLNWDDPVSGAYNYKQYFSPAICYNQGDELCIKGLSNGDNGAISIYSLNGQLVQREGIVIENGQSNVTIGELSDKTYFVTVDCNGQHYRLKWLRSN